MLLDVKSFPSSLPTSHLPSRPTETEVHKNISQMEDGTCTYDFWMALLTGRIHSEPPPTSATSRLRFPPMKLCFQIACGLLLPLPLHLYLPDEPPRSGTVSKLR